MCLWHGLLEHNGGWEPGGERQQRELEQFRSFPDEPESECGAHEDWHRE